MGARPAASVAESPSEIWARVGGALRDLGGGVVAGEVQQVTVASSGHVYFTLADGEATIRCIMWRSAAQRLPEPIRQGQLLEARYSKIDAYARSGSVSLICEAIRTAGEGELLQRVLEVRERLIADGLADPDRKPPLPRFPRRVGLVTGRGSDAETDVVTALRHRFPPVRISVCHALVQGVGAVNDVIDALATLDDVDDVDVIILARGGGSVEDLLPFSDEALCRAISALRTPVITSIGHTKQRPNCDEVASAAAEVPARAAEHAVPSADELARHVERLAEDAADGAAAAIGEALARIDRSAMRPAGQAALVARTARIDLAGQSLSHAGDGATAGARERIGTAALDLGGALAVVPRPATLDVPRERLLQAAAAARHALALGAAAFDGATRLIRARDWRERGFALVRLPDGAVVRDAAALRPGQELAVQLKGATLGARVETITPDLTEADA